MANPITDTPDPIGTDTTDGADAGADVFNDTISIMSDMTEGQLLIQQGQIMNRSLPGSGDALILQGEEMIRNAGDGN